MSPKNKFYTLAAAVIIVLLATTSYLTLFNSTHGGDLTPPVQAQQHFLEVTVSPQEAKLRPGQTQVFTAEVANAIGAVQYEWTARDASGNFTEYRLLQNGSEASFTFRSATEHVILLTVEAVDTAGGRGSADAVIRDPYSASNLYLDSLPSAATYIVEADGLGWYRMLNSSSGQLSMSSTNASAVMNSAFGHLSASTGGGVYVKNGVYTFSSSLVIGTSYTKLMGESLQTELKLGDSANKDLIVIAADVSDVQISNLHLNGNNANNAAGNIINSNTTGIRVDSCRIDYAAENCIKIYNEGEYAGLAWITDNSIDCADGSGIYFSGVYDSFIRGNDIGQNNIGIYLYASSANEINSNQIWGSVTNGISLMGSIATMITDNRIDHNKQNGISLLGSNDTTIADNRIYYNSQQASKQQLRWHIRLRLVRRRKTLPRHEYNRHWQQLPRHKQHAAARAIYRC
jgi:parallel beta-helix repeat protein